MFKNSGRHPLLKLNFNLKKDVERYLFQQKTLNRKNFIEDQNLCKRIKEKYEPFGLEKELPSDLRDLCSSTDGELLKNLRVRS